MILKLSYIRDPGKIADCIEKWLASQVKMSGAKGVVVGLSGGVDSAVVAALSARVFGDETLGVIMPCHSEPVDAADALMVAAHLGIPYRLADLSSIFDSLTLTVGRAVPLTGMARANLKARLRMSTLYTIAQSTSRLVCGTGNRSEWEMGYFTKYGDTASDLLPLLDLLKNEVWAVARYLGLPRDIVERVPSGGLWEGQTDECEMGFTYAELDRYLTTGEADPETLDKISALHAKSEHKRHLAPFCEVPV